MYADVTSILIPDNMILGLLPPANYPPDNYPPDNHHLGLLPARTITP